VYFDTSAIVPIVIEEPSSKVASRLWDEADRVVSSCLVYAEGRAASARLVADAEMVLAAGGPAAPRCRASTKARDSRSDQFLLTD